MAEPFLSLIIPAHNEENRLPGTLQQVLAFLSTQPYSFEVLVVENASLDRTFQVAQEFARHNPQLQVLQCPQTRQGVGGAPGDAGGARRVPFYVRCGSFHAGQRDQSLLAPRPE